ncbi:hypothetical protein [Pseudarcicella hirudinis]|nr:hypothetical protein [Pseudarcicella hirudinis]
MKRKKIRLMQGDDDCQKSFVIIHRAFLFSGGSDFIRFKENLKNDVFTRKIVQTLYRKKT